jgi:hypothetical protein
VDVLVFSGGIETQSRQAVEHRGQRHAHLPLGQDAVTNPSEFPDKPLPEHVIDRQCRC